MFSPGLRNRGQGARVLVELTQREPLRSARSRSVTRATRAKKRPVRRSSVRAVIPLRSPGRQAQAGRVPGGGV